MYPGNVFALLIVGLAFASANAAGPSLPNTRCVSRGVGESLSGFSSITAATSEEKGLLVDEVIRSGRFWFDPRVDAYLEAHADEVAGLARAWYGSEMFPQMIYPRFVETVGKTRSHLMLDPRILCRMDAFLSWSKEYLVSHPGVSAGELRTKFAETLGRSKVFRGMRFEDEEVAATLKKKGIKSAGLEFQDEEFIRKKMLAEINPKGTYSGFGIEISNRQTNQSLEQSLLISVSDWMELAASVGYHHSQSLKMAPSGRLFLFEMDIPEFELIRQAGPLRRGVAKTGGGFYQVGDKWRHRFRKGRNPPVYRYHGDGRHQF